MLLAVGRAVKPCVAGGVYGAGWCVPQHAFDELGHTQAQRCLAQVAMAGVLKLHLSVVHAQLALLGQGSALGVSSQIHRQALAVLVLGFDPYVPVLGIQGAQLLYVAVLVDTRGQL